MATTKDMLGLYYLDLAKRREAGELAYGRRLTGSAGAERNNWNVTANEMKGIEEALRDEQPFTDSRIETDESSLDQINDAVRRMRSGDVSKYNHLPRFLREYYCRKALTEVFGSDSEFPPLDDAMKKKLAAMTVRPEFRDAISGLITRGAVDAQGNSLVPRLREYGAYLNERMLADTLKPVSAEEADLHWKNPEQRKAAIMSANMKILESVADYTRGKEPPRKTLRGVNTFDSALDAAACVQRFAPGARLRNDALIAGINSQRKPGERLSSEALTTEYGRGIDRNSITSREQLAAVKKSLAAPKGRDSEPDVPSV